MGFRNEGIGRFLLEIPTGMRRTGQSALVWECRVSEAPWPQGQDSAKVRGIAWNNRLREIEVLPRPKGVVKSIIEVRDLQGPRGPSRAVQYFGSPITDRVVTWDLLVDGRDQAVWLSVEGAREAADRMLERLLEVGKSYSPEALDAKESPGANGRFLLEHGAFAMPYRGRERTYARWEGHPLGLEFEMETETVAKVDSPGLLARIGAALASGFGQGVGVDKLRTGHRKVAGLAGDEAILRMTKDKESELSFAWRFPGEAESGRRPKIMIEMKTSDGDFEAKAKVWDRLLDSMRPVDTP